MKTGKKIYRNTSNIKKIETELIEILIQKSKQQNSILEYHDTNQIKIILDQYRIKYEKTDLEKIDIVYINIKVEDALR